MHRGRNNDAITPPTCQTKAWLMSEHRNTGAAEEPTRWPGTYKYGNGYMESVKCACVRTADFTLRQNQHIHGKKKGKAQVWTRHRELHARALEPSFLTTLHETLIYTFVDVHGTSGCLTAHWS
eukprot:scaffold65606_cov23-Tisochrysis_lutea.AAC.1